MRFISRVLTPSIAKRNTAKNDDLKTIILFAAAGLLVSLLMVLGFQLDLTGLWIE